MELEERISMGEFMREMFLKKLGIDRRDEKDIPSENRESQSIGKYLQQTFKEKFFPEY